MKIFDFDLFGAFTSERDRCQIAFSIHDYGDDDDGNGETDDITRLQQFDRDSLRDGRLLIWEVLQEDQDDDDGDDDASGDHEEGNVDDEDDGLKVKLMI